MPPKKTNAPGTVFPKIAGTVFPKIAGTVFPKIERVQTGVRMEKRLLKVLKAMAEYHDISLGNLLEGIVLHAFEGRSPFTDDRQEKIRQLMQVYDCDLTAAMSHKMAEEPRDE